MYVIYRIYMFISYMLCIVCMISCICMNIEFNGKFYQEIEGLRMGLPLGPAFANIFMRQAYFIS